MFPLFIWRSRFIICIMYLKRCASFVLVDLLVVPGTWVITSWPPIFISGRAAGRSLVAVWSRPPLPTWTTVIYWTHHAPNCFDLSLSQRSPKHGPIASQRHMCIIVAFKSEFPNGTSLTFFLCRLHYPKTTTKNELPSFS